MEKEIYQPAGAFCPTKTVSEANRRDHWRTKGARTKKQRSAAHYALILWAQEYDWMASMVRAQLDVGQVLLVKLTRVSPRELDDDNLRGALKAVRDGVADWLERDDRDKQVRWVYEQEKDKDQGVFIQFGAVQ